MRTYAWILSFAALTGFMAGCNTGTDGKPYSETEKNAADDEHAGEHAHEHGAHGGHVIELANDHSVHGEFVIDDAARIARFYLTGPDLKTPVEASSVMFHPDGVEGAKATSEIALTSVGGKAMASEFEISVDSLPSPDIEKLAGHFHAKVGDKELTGNLTHDHDHDHDHEMAPAPAK